MDRRRDELLAHWLEPERVSHLVMESTGVYSKPTYKVLKGRSFNPLVVNERSVETCIAMWPVRLVSRLGRDVQGQSDAELTNTPAKAPFHDRSHEPDWRSLNSRHARISRCQRRA